MTNNRTCLGVIYIIQELLTTGNLKKDPLKPNNIFVYCSGSKETKEGWYSKNVMEAASDCFQNKKELDCMIKEAQTVGVDTEKCFHDAYRLLNI